METKIKNLFKLKSTSKKPSDVNFSLNHLDEDTKIRKKTYYEAGFIESERNSGAHTSLGVCLAAIHAKFQNEERINIRKQEELKQPYLKELSEKDTELKGLNITLENRTLDVHKEKEKIQITKDEIEKLNFKINDLSQHPETYGIDASRGASVKFWVGVLLLIPITLYLFTFYTSTSYSAFFKTFNANAGVIESILDAQALSKAWNDGFNEGAFVTLIPFVFLGLGYLIHMFGETKSIQNFMKVSLLVVTTFIFDAILAYQIEYKLYEINRILDSSDFNLAIAFTSVQFWGIIFAGFIVYLIWGLVFDFIMKEHKERDKIKMAQEKVRQDIKVYENRISEYELRLSALDTEIASLREMIEKVKGRKLELQNIIDGIIIPTKEYILYASEYMQGWLTYIMEKLLVSEEVKRQLTESSLETYNSHLDLVGANNGTQNTVYRSVI